MPEHSGKAHRDSDYTIMTIVNNRCLGKINTQKVGGHFPLAALLALKVEVHDIMCVSIISASGKSELVEVRKA